MDRWMDGWIAALGGGFVVVGCGEREGGERGERGFWGPEAAARAVRTMPFHDPAPNIICHVGRTRFLMQCPALMAMWLSSCALRSTVVSSTTAFVVRYYIQVVVVRGTRRLLLGGEEQPGTCCSAL